MPDPYTDPDAQSETTVQAMATRLEERGNHPEFQRMIDDYSSILRNDVPISVLDLGCGTGVVIRNLEKKLHPQSALHGVDISQRLLDVAKKVDPSSRVQWQKNEARVKLPFDDSSFDAIVMHTLLSHVPDTCSIMIDVVRILKPGGRIIAFDADHMATAFGLPDLSRMIEVNQKLAAAIACHPDICRQLPRHIKEAGLQLESHRSGCQSNSKHGSAQSASTCLPVQFQRQ
jgi:ubiquinone/menaquinone biosynthesis C-methylase UbiE